MSSISDIINPSEVLEVYYISPLDKEVFIEKAKYNKRKGKYLVLFKANEDLTIIGYLNSRIFKRLNKVMKPLGTPEDINKLEDGSIVILVLNKYRR